MINQFSVWPFMTNGWLIQVNYGFHLWISLILFITYQEGRPSFKEKQLVFLILLSKPLQ